MTLERVCPRCMYRTTRPVDRCPLCGVPLRHSERAWLRPRRADRLPLLPGVPGTLDDQMRVTVRDLSLLGARLEHAEPLLPALPCLLTIVPPEAAPLCLPAHVAWSRPYPFDQASSEAIALYHSGVEFGDVPPAVTRALYEYLGRTLGLRRE